MHLEHKGELYLSGNSSSNNSLCLYSSFLFEELKVLVAYSCLRSSVYIFKSQMQAGFLSFARDTQAPASLHELLRMRNSQSVDS